MGARLDYTAAAREVAAAMRELQRATERSGLDPRLLELVKLRASQLNGCAYCVDMHSKDLDAAGESAHRIFMLPVWRDAPCYTPRERAALAWAEAVTLVAESHVSDDIYAMACAQFSEQELVGLTLAVIAINGWNRLATSFRTPAGLYQPHPHVG